uniref:Uncharacterized protein n=1 Tax=Timema cristinae TaxID=61476 RepID=A0A7R9CXV3_TIMCR|nr:unnamed protein product [Timema cristinae]
MAEQSIAVILGTKSNPTIVSDSPITDPGSAVKLGDLLQVLNGLRWHSHPVMGVIIEKVLDEHASQRTKLVTSC